MIWRRRAEFVVGANIAWSKSKGSRSSRARTREARTIIRVERERTVRDKSKTRRASKGSECVSVDKGVSEGVGADAGEGVGGGVGVDEGDGAVVKNAWSESSRSALNTRQRVRRTRAHNAGVECEARRARAGSVLNKSNEYARAQNERSESEMFTEREQTSAFDKITQRAEGASVWRSESKERVEREQKCGVRARGALIETLSFPKKNSWWIYQTRHALPNHAISGGRYCPHGAYSLPPSSLTPMK